MPRAALKTKPVAKKSAPAKPAARKRQPIPWDLPDHPVGLTSRPGLELQPLPKMRFYPPDSRRHPERGITRNDRSGHYQVWVTVYSKSGRSLGRRQEHFSYRQHGGREAALRVAKAWKAKEEAKLPKTFKSRGWRLNIDQAGTVLLYRGAYKASIRWNGEQFTSTYSVRKYGDSEAEALAWQDLRAWRKEFKRREKTGKGFDWFAPENLM